MKVRVSGNAGCRDMELPVEDAELAWLAERIGGGSGNLWCTLKKAWGERNPLRRLTGQEINMDELNFFAKRLDSFTAYERSVLEAYAYEQGTETMKDLINLTYSMKGLSLITDFSDAQQVGKRLYMDENTAVSEEESRHINFAEYGEKALAEGECRILPYGVLVVHGFEMQQIYNGRTFPEYLYDADKTVAVLEMKNKAGDRDYLYMPTDLSGVSMMKGRLKILDLRECSVEGIHNVRLPESLVPKPGKLGCAEELAYFNEMCQNVCRFDEEKMKRLAMAAEFVGAKKYTDITYVAKCLNEFDITPSVHNDEEYGKFLVTQSGLFEVDDLLLPHIDYAGFAADRRSGTLEESGYVPGGFVGVEKGIQEFLGYKGEFAELLEKDGDCYEMFCLYSPLKGMLTAGEEEDELCQDALVQYRDEISAAIKEDECIGMNTKGLMHYFDSDREVAAKVASAWPDVCEIDGELYGVLICETKEALTERDIRVLKDYWTGQAGDGWGESFEQQPIRVEDGEICVSFWNAGKSWKVMTAQELGIRQDETMEMLL